MQLNIAAFNLKSGRMKVYDIDNDSIINIDDLIEAVLNKGTVRTGIDIFNYNDHLIIPGNLTIKTADILKITKAAGIRSIPVQIRENGGIWDKTGKSIIHRYKKKYRKITSSDVEKQIASLIEQKKEAQKKVNEAKNAVRKVINDIRSNGGRFDYNEVENTVVQLIDVISENSNPYLLLAKNIFSYDDYLLDHSINVCTIGTAVLYQMNRLFKDLTIYGRKNKAASEMLKKRKKDGKGEFYSKEEIKQISTGFFLHDIGKVAVPEELLNKKGHFSKKEFEIVKKHSFEYGKIILEKNGINNRLIKNSVLFHHSPLYNGELRTYPDLDDHKKIPEYVKICKLSDIYDAMTSKRAYKDAVNPAEVVTRIYKSYSNKCNILQLLLHSFVKSIGNIPPGTIVQLKNAQYAFVLDSNGPVIILLTDKYGKKLPEIPDPVNLNDYTISKEYEINPATELKAPMDSFSILPEFLKRLYEK